MKKADAINLFGSIPTLAGVLSKTPQAIYQWGEDLTKDQALMVVGAAYLTRRELPSPSHKMFEGVVERRGFFEKKRNTDKA